MTHEQIMKKRWASLSDLKEHLDPAEVLSFNGWQLETRSGSYGLFDSGLVFTPLSSSKNEE